MKAWTRALLTYAGVPLAAITTKLLFATLRKTRHNTAASETAPGVIAIYHGDMFGVLSERHRYSGRNHVLVSRSRDGELLTRFLQWFAMLPIRGSSSRGGTQAVKELVKVLRHGDRGIVAVDGPRGPRAVVKMGAVLAAAQSGRPLLPAAVLPDRYWQFRSWDRMRVPKPFTRCRVIVNSPIHIPKDATRDQLEAVRRRVELELAALHGEPPPESAPAESPSPRSDSGKTC